MTEAKPGVLAKKTSIPGMLIFGTSTVVIQKLIFSMSAVGRPDNPSHTFEKPWFQTEAMFLGMFLCLVVYEIKRLMERHAVVSDVEKGLLVEGKPKEEEEVAHWKKYIYVIAPAMCDMLATSSMNIGLLWIPASVWQMMRGSMVIFSAILSIIFLKRHLYKFNWIGISFVMLGLVIVAYACIKGDFQATSENNVAPPTTNEEICGIVMVVVAQVIQASQIVIEEFLLKNIKADPFLIVGLEGFWGGIVCSLVLIPVAYVPENSSLGSAHGYEDTIDTLDMMKNNNRILMTGILYVFAILFYNLFGMLVTFSYTAVHRTILEAVRTMCIWVTDLFIHYAVDSGYGEVLNGWSLLELAGFISLLFGLFVYNKVIRLAPPQSLDTATRDAMAAPARAWYAIRLWFGCEYPAPGTK